MNVMQRTIITLGWLATITGIFLIIVVTFWMTYPYKILVFNGKEFPVVNKTVKQGGLLTYISDYCKYKKLTATVAREFVNDLVFVTPETTTSRETGCHVINVSITIPHELPPGKYRLHNIYQYTPNPFRSIVVEHGTEEFEVVE